MSQGDDDFLLKRKKGEIETFQQEKWEDEGGLMAMKEKCEHRDSQKEGGCWAEWLEIALEIRHECVYVKEGGCWAE